MGGTVMAMLLASILDADWLNLDSEIRSVDEAGVDGFSLDIMNGTFVPRMTFGPHIVSKIRNSTDLPIEVHLMINNPEKQIETFCDAGADQILFHIEATTCADEIINYVHSRNISVGIAVLLDTDLRKIPDKLIASIDAINFMAVTVGYGGQQASNEAINRIQEFRRYCESVNHDIAIEVDGGIKQDNCRAYVEAGADLVVIGTGIYHASNYKEAVSKAQSEIYHDDVISKKRLKQFLSGNSILSIDDIERRKRLDALRIALDIPQCSWDPMNSKR